MLIRISLIVAIIAALAVGVLNFVQVKNKITTLQNNLAEQTRGRQVAETDLAKTKKELTKTAADLKQTQENLTAANAAKDKAVSDLDVANKKNVVLTEDLAKTKSERDNFQADLSAYKLVFPTAEQAANSGKQIRQLQDDLAGAQGENVLLSKQIVKLKNQVAKFTPGRPPVELPITAQGKIWVVDPKWEFVVLDIGDSKGVLEDAEMLVSRDGKLVAKIIIRSVEKDRSIAYVVPGWKVGELMEGDHVMPAHPQS